ncbi:prephenate dehydrogenase/arogenate dehydrogenase family protein [Pelagibacterium halotolerans]|uniref:prephenate dehydrogenase/arogenate dehydrogenase family protein n=1 Tax=Pelagibacterium halotolerans TaxID=531813 RepID=UPI00384DD06A
MSHDNPEDSNITIGIIGFGAFGQLIARHVAPLFRMLAFDPAPDVAAIAQHFGVVPASLEAVASCPVVVLAMPVERLESVVEAIAPHIQRGALVLDVGSVKAGPARIMQTRLPGYADIVATHPLFGPQSAREGIAGLKIAVCAVRGSGHLRVGAFLRRHLRLTVIMTTPEDHDREAATVQGLTHLIAKVLVEMEPLPTRMTTRSFDLLLQAVEMVRHDAPEVFTAIERANPYAAGVRKRFFELASALEAEFVEAGGPVLEDHTGP